MICVPSNLINIRERKIDRIKATIGGHGCCLLFEMKKDLKKNKRNQSNGFVVNCVSTVSDPYKTLRIHPGASEFEVKKAFRQLALLEEEYPPNFALHFPSPFLDDNQLLFNHIFPHHQQQLMVADDQINHKADLGCRVTNKRSISTINTREEISVITTAATHHLPMPSSSEVAQKGKTSTNDSKGPSTQRKRGKKDRHSKIYTAQGLRDRRMRLSLQISRKFFDLQDMLGFDKASKTIDWLFSKSKKAIKQLSCTANHLPQMNNTMPSIYCHQIESEETRKVITTSDGENISDERKTQKLRKAAGGGGCGTKYNHIAKELRDKARARAKERTREKMMIRCLENSKQQHYLSDHQTTPSYNLAQLGSAGNPNSVFSAGEEELMTSRSQENSDVSPYKDLSSHISLHHQLANVGILENFLGSTATSSAAASCSIFDYQRNDALLLFSGKNPTSIFMENSGYHHFQSENQAD